MMILINRDNPGFFSSFPYSNTGPSHGHLDLFTLHIFLHWIITSSPSMSDENISEKHDAATVEMLRRYQTAESVLLPIPRDAFEKLYLSPKTPAAGNLRRTFGNPTPISLLGFLLAATPAAMLTMGWGNSGGNGGAIL